MTNIDLLAPEFVANPHPTFHRLRETTPVAWSERQRGWVVTRYDDVAASFRDSRLSADRMTPMFERLAPDARGAVELAERHLTRWIVFMDPPGHDRLRRLVARAFTPPRMEAVRADVRAVVMELLDTFPDDGTAVPFVHRFAYPLPAQVVARVLGVPAEDRERFASWSAEIATIVFGPGSGDVARFERAQRGLASFDSYIRAFADDVRHARRPPSGLVAELVAVHDEGDRLDADELVATCTLLVFAGQETTTGLLNNTIAVLADEEHDHGASAFVADPVPAVEEAMRFVGPTRSMIRTATEDVVLPSGHTIPASDRVYLMVSAANRDPARFADPDRFDPARKDNQHLGFGSGIHHCLGAPLARIEAQEGLRALYAAFPDLEVATPITWGGGLLGVSASAVAVTPGRRRTAP